MGQHFVVDAAAGGTHGLDGQIGSQRDAMLLLSHYADRYGHHVSDNGPPGAAAQPGRPGQRWLVLAAGTLALTAGCCFQYGLAYLIPALRAQGLSLAQAGLLVACPTMGLLLTLIGWGAVTDRWGERLVLASGLGAAGLVLLAATQVRGTAALGACLVVAGAAGAAVYAASGRLILGWFAARERGLAMGIRQSAQPLGIAVAAGAGAAGHRARAARAGPARRAGRHGSRRQ